MPEERQQHLRAWDAIIQTYHPLLLKTQIPAIARVIAGVLCRKNGSSTCVQRGTTLKGFDDFYLKAKAKIWP